MTDEVFEAQENIRLITKNKALEYTTKELCGDMIEWV